MSVSSGRPMKIANLAISALGALVFLTLLCCGAWFYNAQEQHLRRKVEMNLDTIARLKTDQITAWQKARRDDARMLAEGLTLSTDTTQGSAESLAGMEEETLKWFRTMARHYRYHDILLIDPEGNSRLSLSGDTTAYHRAAAEALAASLRERQPAFTELHTGHDDAMPHISVVAPIFSNTGDGFIPMGAVVLVNDAREFLFPLIQFWPVLSETAETLLVRRDGDDVLFLNDLRHQADTALKLRIPLTRRDMPEVKVVLGQEGVVGGKDYRGVEVLAVVRAVPDSSWFIVAKEDTAEAFSACRSRSVLILLLLSGFVTLSAVSMLLLRQRVAKAHYLELYHSEAARRRSEERYGITLKSIGEAVVTTDAAGRVELLNPVAEALTGWTAEEACGRPLDEVFHIINEETRQTVESPVERVLREGLVVGLANHTLLISRDCVERPVADSGAPIRDDQGKIIGVVLTFRDQTDELAAQRALRAAGEKWQTTFDSMLDSVALMNVEGTVEQCNRIFASFIGREAETLIGRKCCQLIHNTEDHIPECPVVRARKSGRREEMELPVNGRAFHVLVDPVKAQGGELIGFIHIMRDITRQKRVEAEREKFRSELLQAQKIESVGRLAGGVAHDYNNMLGVILGYAELAMTRLGAGDPLRIDIDEIQKAARRSADLTRRLLAFARKQTIAPQVLDLNDTVASMLTMLRRLIGEDIDFVWKPGAGLSPVKVDPAQIDQILANLCVNARDAISGVGKVIIETDEVTFGEANCANRLELAPGDFVMLAVSDDGCGMDNDTKEHLFEPFFTTKEFGKGTGLGLATVYGIVKQNGGFINVYSETGKGTTFKIYLPRHGSPAIGTAAEESAVIPQSRGGTVLLVEDEPSLLQMGKRMIERLGYGVLTANGAGEAIRLATEYAGEIDLLLTDVVMPEMNGLDLSKRLMSLYPALRCMFMSGYTADVIASQGVLDPGLHFIQKPFSIDVLGAKIREALDA